MCYYKHLRRSVRTSASVGADICVGRYGHLRRSVRTSASVGADICIGRCGHLRRSVQTSASVGARRANASLRRLLLQVKHAKVSAWTDYLSPNCQYCLLFIVFTGDFGIGT